MDAHAIGRWLDVLDSISYYELFRIPPSASFDDLRVAFHTFAESFHPDIHTWRARSEQDAIGYIFKRGTEAYRVLCDPTLRARYDQALAMGILRPESLIVQLGNPQSKSFAPAANTRLIDKVRTVGAKQFVLRAEELVKNGDPRQAKIQLVMAMHMDPNNPALEAYAKELDETTKAKADADRKVWKKEK